MWEGILIGLLPFTAIGLLFFVQVFVRPKRPPMDKSNRINHLRLVWFALKHPEDFVELYRHGRGPAFPWLTRDEGENVDG
jgi:hypothetical protein